MITAGAAAQIAGREAPLNEAIDAAAALLRRSRLPLIAGLSGDVAAIRRALELARAVGGVADHVHSRIMLRDTGVMRQNGWIVTTPPEVRARADLLLLVGPGIGAAWNSIARHLCRPDTPPRVLHLGAERSADLGFPSVEPIPARASDLPLVLGQLLALLRARPIAVRPGPDLTSCAEALAACRFGVAVWSAAALEPVTIEMICALVGHLNDRTRFSGLPIPPGENAWGANQVAAWMTGFPLPVSFARNLPEHDPWQFDSERLIESEEADAALWLSSLGAAAPNWTRRVPTIVLSTPGTRLRQLAADISIAVGQPGADHDGVMFDAGLGALAAFKASSAGGAPTADDVLLRIIARVQAEPSAC